MQRTVLERELNPAPVPAPSSASKVPEHKQPHPDQKSNVTCQVVLLLDIFEQCSLISLSWKSQTYGFYFDWIRNLLEPYTTPRRKKCNCLEVRSMLMFIPMSTETRVVNLFFRSKFATTSTMCAPSHWSPLMVNHLKQKQQKIFLLQITIQPLGCG